MPQFLDKLGRGARYSFGVDVSTELVFVSQDGKCFYISSVV